MDAVAAAAQTTWVLVTNAEEGAAALAWVVSRWGGGGWTNDLGCGAGSAYVGGWGPVAGSMQQ